MTRSFKKDEEVECRFCSFWLKRKNLPTYLRKNHADKFAGPDPDACLDLSDFNLNEFCRERRFNKQFYVQKIVKMREQWTEEESGGKRGAAIEARFFLEDENGEKIEKTQKGLVELREIMNEELWQSYLNTVLTKKSGRSVAANRHLAERFKIYEEAIKKTLELPRPTFCHLCQCDIEEDEGFLSFFIKEENGSVRMCNKNVNHSIHLTCHNLGYESGQKQLDRCIVCRAPEDKNLSGIYL